MKIHRGLVVPDVYGPPERVEPMFRALLTLMLLAEEGLTLETAGIVSTGFPAIEPREMKIEVKGVRALRGELLRANEGVKP